jgi:hypothetical protein
MVEHRRQGGATRLRDDEDAAPRVARVDLAPHLARVDGGLHEPAGPRLVDADRRGEVAHGARTMVRQHHQHPDRGVTAPSAGTTPTTVASAARIAVAPRIAVALRITVAVRAAHAVAVVRVVVLVVRAVRLVHFMLGIAPAERPAVPSAPTAPLSGSRAPRSRAARSRTTRSEAAAERPARAPPPEDRERGFDRRDRVGRLRPRVTRT